MSAINESFIFVALWPIGAVLFCLLEIAVGWIRKRLGGSRADDSRPLV